MYSYKLNSHPGILLIKHLRNVGDRCEELVANKNIDFNYSKEKLSYVAKVMGYTHDLGKGTAFFQKYLKDMNENGESDVDTNLKSHGYLSALCTYFQLKQFDKNLAMIAFIITRKHHGDLDNLGSETSFSKQKIKADKKQLQKQFEALNFKEISSILIELGLADIGEDIIDLIDEIEDIADELLDGIENCGNYEDYILYKFLYSVLIYADKEDAVFHSKNDIDYDLPHTLVENYKKIRFKNKSFSLGDVRDSIYNDVIKSIEKCDNRIMSITVPTGTGKTLTSMAAALKLKEKLKKDMKIIYCLPFTSVIDQNYEVYSDIIKTVMGEDKATNNRILKHHHLTEISYNNEYKNFDNKESKFLIENWNSQVVVTTFMQFFTCLFSNHNSELVKYNNFADSIVLLDEIQSVPYKYWLIINELFKVMAEKLNMYFILITATQPLIFRKNEIKELVPDNQKYFNQFKRTKLNIDLNEISYEDFLSKIEELILDNEEKSVLIILNTVRLSQKVYDFINSMDIDADIYFLSTGIVPKERKARIESIKYSKGRKIVVSTQLIEAGVDIDMDIVIRSMATLDSINQSAGRCNRECRGQYLGEVYIFNILDENGRRNSSVYDEFLIEKTKEVLKGKSLVLEEDYLELNNKYFTLVSENMSKNESRSLIKMISNLRFNDVRESFKLIEQQDKVSIFIEVDEEARHIWRIYQQILKEKDVFIMKEKFGEIKKDFYDNVINVFKNKVKETEKNGIVYISHEALRGVYNTETGYILQEKDAML